jgi:hypothetical protein
MNLESLTKDFSGYLQRTLSGIPVRYHLNTDSFEFNYAGVHHEYRFRKGEDGEILFEGKLTSESKPISSDLERKQFSEKQVGESTYISKRELGGLPIWCRLKKSNLKDSIRNNLYNELYNLFIKEAIKVYVTSQ